MKMATHGIHIPASMSVFTIGRHHNPPLLLLCLLLLSCGTTCHGWIMTLAAVQHQPFGNKDNHHSNNHADEEQHERFRPFGLQVHEFTTTGRGVRTMCNRVPGDCVIQGRDGITADSILTRYPTIRQLVELPIAEPQDRVAAPQSRYTKDTDNPDLANDKSNNNHQNINNNHHWDDEQILALGLLEMRRHQDPYALTLPKDQYSVLTVPETLQSCLPRCYRDWVEACKEYAKQIYTKLCHVMKRNSTTTSTSYTNTTTILPTLDEFLWALATVRSRSVAADELPLHGLLQQSQRRVLLPGFDMFNHKRDALASLELCIEQNAIDNDDNDAVLVWKLTCHESYEMGDQIFINYGNRDNVKFLVTYGFCPVDTTTTTNTPTKNPDNLILFDFQDLWQASYTARPTIYTPRIRPQLERIILELSSSSSLSSSATGGGLEQQIIFSHDGSQPRESLKGGLQLMQQVAQQITGHASQKVNGDDELVNDILQCLMKTRHEELCQGIAKLQDIDTQVGWEQFKSSMAILMEAERDLVLPLVLD